MYNHALNWCNISQLHILCVEFVGLSDHFNIHILNWWDIPVKIGFFLILIISVQYMYKIMR